LGTLTFALDQTPEAAIRFDSARAGGINDEGIRS
jgi:hypothetical protein